MLKDEFGDSYIQIVEPNGRKVLTLDVNQDTPLNKSAIYWRLDCIDCISTHKDFADDNAISLYANEQGTLTPQTITSETQPPSDKNIVLNIGFNGDNGLKLLTTTSVLDEILKTKQVDEIGHYSDFYKPELRNRVLKLRLKAARGTKATQLIIALVVFVILALFGLAKDQPTNPEYLSMQRIILDLLTISVGAFALWLLYQINIKFTLGKMYRTEEIG